MEHSSGPVVDLVDDQPSANPALAVAIAAAYLRELREVGSLLAATPAAAARRLICAEQIIEDVCRLLDGGQQTRRVHEPPLSVDELDDVAAFSAAMVDGNARLFSTGLQQLALAELGDPIDIASALSLRLAAESLRVIEAIADAKVLQRSATEMVDRRRLGELLTEREASVFRMLLEDAPIKLISSELHISPHTAKHHITSIGRKLNASGRVDVIRRARELGVLIAVPAAVAGAVVTDAIAVIGSIF